MLSYYKCTPNIYIFGSYSGVDKNSTVGGYKYGRNKILLSPLTSSHIADRKCTMSKSGSERIFGLGFDRENEDILTVRYNILLPHYMHTVTDPDIFRIVM